MDTIDWFDTIPNFSDKSKDYEQDRVLISTFGPEYRPMATKQGLWFSIHTARPCDSDIKKLVQEVETTEKNENTPRNFACVPRGRPFLLTASQANFGKDKYCARRIHKILQKVESCRKQDYLLLQRIEKRGKENKADVILVNESKFPEDSLQKKSIDEKSETADLEQDVKSEDLKQEQKAGTTNGEENEDLDKDNKPTSTSASSKSDGKTHVDSKVFYRSSSLPFSILTREPKFAMVNVIWSCAGVKLEEPVIIIWRLFDTKEEADEWALNFQKTRCKAAYLPDLCCCPTNKPILAEIDIDKVASIAADEQLASFLRAQKLNYV